MFLRDIGIIFIFQLFDTLLVLSLIYLFLLLPLLPFYKYLEEKSKETGSNRDTNIDTNEDIIDFRKK